MERKLEGKVAIVTGAGGGMGRAISILFAKHGAKVLATDLNEATVNETKEMVLAEGGVAEAMKVDMGNPDEVIAMVKKAADTFGTVDILINNAGMDSKTPVSELEVEAWNKVFAVNVTGPFVAIKESLKYMVPQHSGHIVNICSIASLTGTAGGIAYIATKHALLGATKEVAYECGHQGVRVNAICPGAVYSGMCPREVIDNPPTEMVKRLVDTLLAVPAGRVGEPEDIANAALFLCTDESSFIYGQRIVVDGGWTI